MYNKNIQWHSGLHGGINNRIPVAEQWEGRGEAMEKDRIKTLRETLDNSRYTVALCGSGMMEEGGFVGVKLQDRAYEIEAKYGESPEYLFSSAYYHTRPEQFFKFYKAEMLANPPKSTASAQALRAMEQAGKLQSIITANIFELPQQAGCQNVINLHGSIYENECSHCRRKYSVDMIKDARGIPLCDTCGAVVRPKVALFGEQVDSQVLARATIEVERADVLLVLGTTLKSDVFAHYVRYFNGRSLVIIHKTPHHLDHRANLTIIDHPMNVLPLLGY